jgi:hypothetical protein
MSDPLNVGHSLDHLDVVWCATDHETFELTVLDACESSPIVDSMLSRPEHVDGTIYVLSTDGQSGYAVRPSGELVNVFSLVKGRGARLVRHALMTGAVYLDCFDGYLTSFYGRHGFREVGRVANWTPGGPDVVYMHV